jgi:DNA-binding beta-propeller fold protein YncE
MRLRLAIPVVLCLGGLFLPSFTWASIGFVAKWGSAGSGNGQFNSPSEIAVDGTGQVYVVDTNNHRVQKFRGDGTFLLSWGSQGTGNGQFQFPRGIAVDPAGNVLVVDSDNNRVQKFTSGGAYITQWGTAGTGNGQFQQPRSITTDAAGFVFVTEDALASKRVQKFTSAGVYVTKWGASGGGDGQFAGPRGIAVDDIGYVYVSDTLNNRVQKFTNAGAFVTKWGTNGSGTGQFVFPIGIAARDGQIFVVDQNNNRVQQFTRTGGYVSQFGTLCELSSTSGCVDPDGGGPRQLGDGQFNAPIDIATDRYGFLFVIDAGNSRIEKFGDPLVVGLPDGGNVNGLFRVAPNPFRAQTRISFTVPQGGANVVVRVLDVAGREVRRVWDGDLPTGDYDIPWDGGTNRGTPVPEGLYFVVVNGASRTPQVMKLVRVP